MPAEPRAHGIIDLSSRRSTARVRRRRRGPFKTHFTRNEIDAARAAVLGLRWPTPIDPHQQLA
jgi:hypothetical protein